jgi:hypothetical protein
MKQHALALAKRGLAVFPLKPRDKIPLTTHGCKDASCSPERIEEWWSKWPDANIGIATGAPSSIFVLDIDGDEGSVSLAALEQKFGTKLPETIDVTTGRGRHRYFRLPDWDDAPVIHNSTAKIGPKLDVRGEGGYVVAPPSIHPSGRKYAWELNCAQGFAEAPVWLVGLLIPSPVAELDQRRGSEHWQRIARGVPEGSRTPAAASLTGKLLRSGFDPQTTLDIMLGWNMRCDPPQDEKIIVKTVEDILRMEIERRSRTL